MSDAPFVLASGPRAVALGAATPDMLIVVTGDQNTISLTRQGAFAFHLLDEAFRQARTASRPAAFYDGTRPNWTNIARHHDAPRDLYQALWDFATDPHLPPQRAGIILGLAGEGKTTLLMRLAWDLAAAGYPVLWRHQGTVLPNARIPLHGDRPLILAFDSIDQEPDLPQLLADLQEIGLPFVVLGNARPHEWRAADLESRLRALVRVRFFHLGRLSPAEARAILNKLEAADKLDRLADLAPEARVQHFLARHKAAGQLLPALLTARAGQADFTHFVLSVLENLGRRPDGPFLLRGYAFIAALHRFDFGMPRELLARCLDLTPDMVGPRLLRPLEGELLEITQTERRLYTRHPAIAEEAFRLITRRRLGPEAEFVYQAIFAGLQQRLSQGPAEAERKLLTLLPLAFQRRGQHGRARALFQLATQADPVDAPTWQAWALMEARLGRHDRARALLKDGLQQVRAAPDRALPLSTLGSLLARAQRYAEAEDAFRQALALHDRAPLTHYHYAWDCLRPQGRREEACRHLRRARELGARKDKHRQKIQRALKRLGCDD